MAPANGVIFVFDRSEPVRQHSNRAGRSTPVSQGSARPEWVTRILALHLNYVPLGGDCHLHGTYAPHTGSQRAERDAGLFVVAAIIFSACAVGVEAVSRTDRLSRAETVAAPPRALTSLAT